MKYLHFTRLLFIALLFIAPVVTTAQVSYTIHGFVVDNNSNQLLVGARVELVVNNTATNSTTSGSDGSFSIKTSRLQSFNLRVSLTGYQTYSSSPVLFNAGTADYNQGTIKLVKNQVSAPASIMSSTDFVDKTLGTYLYVPTHGAYTLFYALNPGLKNRTEVPSDYKVNAPVLPSFRSVKRTFKKQFKKDKKRDEPYIYASASPLYGDNEMVLLNREYREGSRRVNKSFLSNAVDGIQPQFINREGLFAAKTKKFVFVFFKMDGNYQPVFVEKRYKVFYYPDNVSGNESLYNKIGNATYGYAPMKAQMYNVEVYDQQNNKRMRISDDVVDPQVFFERNDVLTELLNVWIKISIQVYE